MSQRISIKRIAEEAGVSTATVSRVINAPDKVAYQTRLRVESIIRAYEYQPSLLAKGLRNSQMPIIGIMVPDIANEFFANLVIHLQQYLFENGFWAIICNSNLSKAMQQSYLKMLMDQNISGLFVISFDNTSIDLPEHIPMVFVDRHPSDCARFSKYAIVESDNYQGGKLAAESLLQAGCRHPAIISTTEAIHIFSERERGFFSVLKAHGLEMAPQLIRHMNRISIPSGMQAVQELLSTGLPFDGIFATADFWAIGALQGLKEHNLPVPEAVKLVGFDDMSFTSYCQPPLASVHQYFDRIAASAVEAMLRLIEQTSTGNISLKIPVKLIERESVVAAPLSM